jgi:prolyl-tRNA synthetase
MKKHQIFKDKMIRDNMSKERAKKEVKSKMKQEMKENKIEKNQLGITADKDDFSDWFTQLMLKADLADYTDVSGCIVFKPASYEIWQKIQTIVDKGFKKFGVRNAYFPLFIPEKFLNKEKEHVEGFSPEVAWVTEAGDSKLNEKLAIRPTSETIMYPSYSKWIRSWRDLPFRMNQWNNVVRWEFKHPVPFFRTREFLWSELHTVLSNEKEALEEHKLIREVYEEVAQNNLAVYNLTGKKTDREKFAGGVASWKGHYFLPNGKCAEVESYHYDGQNFAKAYGIKFLNNESKEEFGYQNTYGLSTRLLGVMFATHADEKGLIIPPKIALNSIVIIPILFEETKEKVLKEASKIAKELEEFNAFVDSRENYKPGFKFNEWELKGIPIRIEIGPRDLEKGKVILARRDTSEKKEVAIKDIKKEASKILEDIQIKLFEKAKKRTEAMFEKTDSLEKFKKIIENKKVGIVPLCTEERCEESMKSETKGAKALFISEKDKIKAEKCIICNKQAEYFVYAGKSY